MVKSPSPSSCFRQTNAQKNVHHSPLNGRNCGLLNMPAILRKSPKFNAWPKSQALPQKHKLRIKKKKINTR